MNYIDMHCDTLAEALVRKSSTAEHLEGTMVDAARLKESGLVWLSKDAGAGRTDGKDV